MTAQEMGHSMPSDSCQRAMVATGVLLLSAACTDQGADEAWGPLAVAAMEDGGEALITGTIKVTDQCVHIDEQGESVLLVWPEDRTSWDAGGRSILYDANGEAFTLRDGDDVSLGGSGSGSEDNQSAEEFIQSVDWVAQPETECVTGVRWFVSSVVDPP